MSFSLVRIIKKVFLGIINLIEFELKLYPLWNNGLPARAIPRGNFLAIASGGASAPQGVAGGMFERISGNQALLYRRFNLPKVYCIQFFYIHWVIL